MLSVEEYDALVEMDPYKFLKYIQTQFYVDTPLGFDTLQDISGVANILMELTAKKELLYGLAAYLKLKTREKKREGDKLIYEDMVDRKEIVEYALDILKDKYAAISRSVTIVMNKEGIR